MPSDDAALEIEERISTTISAVAAETPDPAFGWTIAALAFGASLFAPHVMLQATAGIFAALAVLWQHDARRRAERIIAALDRLRPSSQPQTAATKTSDRSLS